MKEKLIDINIKNKKNANLPILMLERTPLKISSLLKCSNYTVYIYICKEGRRQGVCLGRQNASLSTAPALNSLLGGGGGGGDPHIFSPRPKNLCGKIIIMG